MNLTNLSSALLIGKNGAGKSTIAHVLQILQAIARGTNRMRDLANPLDYFVGPKDFTRGRVDVPMRFEIEILLDKRFYKYVLVLEFPKGFRELRVAEELFSVDGNPVYSRKEALVTLHKTPSNKEVTFPVDWHLVALPIIQEQSEMGALHLFKTWLAQMIILAPIPTKMIGISSGETLEPRCDGSNFAEWYTGLLSLYPAAYSYIDNYIKGMLPDMQYFRNVQVGSDSKSMQVQFTEKDSSFPVEFNDLSDGEKCFFLCAIVLAANKFYGPCFCFWDEPDNYLSLSEIGHFVIALRSTFNKSGQILMASHNPEIIRKFSNENTFILDRKSHLEPTLIKLLSEAKLFGNLVDALIRWDIQL
jgi:ABC-type cobalamin/Fe3+-siderophores transport system ATPase subunit